MLSARATALSKLAHTGLGSLSIPDVLHLSHDLATGYSLSIFGRLRQAKRDLEHATQGLETLQKNAEADPRCLFRKCTANPRQGDRPVAPTGKQ